MPDIRKDIQERLGSFNEKDGASVQTILGQILEEFMRGGGKSDGFTAANALTEQTKLLGTQATDIAERRVNLSLEALLGKAFGLEAEENRRHDAALGRLEAGLSETDGRFESIMRGLEGDLFSRQADRIQETSSANLSGLRSALGQSGIGADSGTALGIASNINLDRLGQITGAKRDTALATAQQRIQFNDSRFKNIAGIAGFESQSPSLLGLDSLGFLTNLRLNQQGNEETKRAGQLARADAKDAATIGAIGGIVGGLF